MEERDREDQVVYLEQKDLRVNQDLMVLLVHLDYKGDLVSLVNLAVLVDQDPLVEMVTLDAMDKMVPKEPLDSQEGQV